jgi:hypothetical protein
MKTTLKKYCATMILALTLAFSAFAGDMSVPGSIPTPPPPPQEQHITGDMSVPGAATISDMSGLDIDPITSLALNLLRSVFSLF